ncbi:uncharacterized protein BX663DRAFT_557598 [Cokeromyces recurvatus]|uniref:uncharacterized protein n=1 Tax=Cokeromyces recurvatus TaxID=90255 RepID=UPI00221E4695|nr:uncharacterized protein BX663DRAFT_557598 [Cokeromyces recurvatus]KAI7906972.1 hypothetical protein BX663DRAFT_557598 [Cokeromyces recurvatus]
MELTPKQLHYFKRELITQQLEKEINLISTNPNIINDEGQEVLESRTLPFLSYIFHHIIVEFPLLKHHTSDQQFWSKCRLFLNEMNKVQLSSFYTPRTTEGNLQRKSMQSKIQKSLVFAFCASIKTKQGKEENIRIHDGMLQEDLPRTTLPIHSPSLFKVNIVAVREIKTRRTLREVSHAEFIIETLFVDASEPIYVARRHGDFRHLRDQLRHHFKHLDLPLVPTKSSSNQVSSSLYRENDRLLLRAFLYHLIGDPIRNEEGISHQQQQIRRSSMMRKFLTKDPIVFTLEEEEDILRREEADEERWIQKERLQQELNKRVYELNDTLELMKKDIMKRGGLKRLFEIIKNTKSIEDLPPSLKKVFEWGRINFAFALHKQFITSDTATENLNNLKRTHSLMPYRTMSLLLRFSNPMSMIKGILDLFLAQPFGGRSLFQRLIISNMNEEVKALEKQIDLLEKKVNDKEICQKLYNAVRTPLPKESDLKTYKTRIMELTSILGNHEIKPILSNEQLIKVATLDETDEKKKWMKYINHLWELYTNQYEQELMIHLVFQGITGDLLKELISIFYQPLAQVYKAADISTTIKHVSSFIDDLIHVIMDDQKGVETNKRIQSFIDLVQRHEHHFYEFVHNVHTQEASSVFDELIQYLDTLFDFISQGIPGQIDLDECIEKAAISSFPQGLELLRKEIDAICEYRYKQKMHHFERQKCRMTAQHGFHDYSTKEDHDTNFLQYVFKSNEIIISDLEEFEYEDTESDYSYNSSSNNSGSGSSRSSSRRSSKSYPPSFTTNSSGSFLESRRNSIGIQKPMLEMIPKITPVFVEQVIYLMNQ